MRLPTDGSFSQITAAIRAARQRERDDGGKPSVLSSMRSGQSDAPSADDAASFVRAMMRCGAMRRGEIGPEMPDDPVAAAIVMAGKRRRNEA